MTVATDCGMQLSGRRGTLPKGSSVAKAPAERFLVGVKVMLPSFKKSEAEAPRLQPMSPAAAPLGQRPAPLQARPSTAPSVIGADLTISGNLTSKGEVQIDGEVQGDINGTNVVIGEKAKISGNIVADEVVIRGHVMGSIRGRRVMLQASCRVEGDIYHQSVSIEQGAFFEGKSRRTEDPTGTTTRIEAPAPGPVSLAPQAAPAVN